MELSFSRNRFNALLRTQAIGAFGALLPRLIDLIVSGNLLGVDALAGVALVMPIFLGGVFVANLISNGASYLFSRYQGAFEREKARETVGLSLELAIGAGLLFFLILFFGRDVYLDLMGATGEIRAQAIAYWRWESVFISLMPLSMSMRQLIYADGETVTTAIGDCLAPVLILVLSILFVKIIGTAEGASLGTLVGSLTCDFLIALHLFRKTNSVVPAWFFSWARVREQVMYSMSDAIQQLCGCFVLTIVEGLVVSATSPRYLPVTMMLALVLSIREVMDRIGDAYVPIAGMYHAEGDFGQVQHLARYATRIAVSFGLVIAVGLLVFARPIVSVYGIPEGDIFEHSVWALRVCSIVLPLTTLFDSIFSHCVLVGRIRLSFFSTILDGFVQPAVCAAVLVRCWGLDALWLGFPTSALLTAVLLFAYFRLHRSGRSFLLVPEAASSVLGLTFVPQTDRIIEIRNSAEEFLASKRVPSGVVFRIMLLVEEWAMSLVDANRRAQNILAEATLSVRDAETCLVLRDTGRMGDVTDDEQQVSSLRSFVISEVMRTMESRRYLTTLGCNRSALVFPHASEK